MPKFGASIYSISRKIMSGELTPEAGVQWLADNGCPDSIYAHGRAYRVQYITA